MNRRFNIKDAKLLVKHLTYLESLFTKDSKELNREQKFFVDAVSNDLDLSLDTYHKNLKSYEYAVSYQKWLRLVKPFESLCP